MTDIRAKSLITPSRPSGGWSDVRMTPDGALYTTDYGLSVGAEGRVFAAYAGSVTTPLTTAATSALANTIPHLWVRVPEGTAIIPLYCKLTIETSGNTTQGEASLVIAQNDIGNGTSTAATGPLSLNTASAVTSSCTARNLATGAATAPTNPLEITRFSWVLSTANTSFEWNAGEIGVFPVIRGAGSWALYLGGNAVIYYASMIWAEIAETGIS